MLGAFAAQYKVGQNLLWSLVHMGMVCPMGMGQRT